MTAKERIFLAMLFLVVSGGTASLIYGTTCGIGTGPDSAVYVGVARNLLQGKGLTIPFVQDQMPPMTHYPPLYPLLLAAGGSLGIDPLVGARYFNILFFAGSISLVGLLVYLYTGSVLIASMGAAIVACSPVILGVHLWASSEPPFLFFLLTSVYLLSRYLDAAKPTHFLGASVASAFLVLTRYAGLAFVAAGSLSLLLSKKGGLRNTLCESMKFLWLSLIPVALWILRNIIMAGTAANRTFEVHMITSRHFLLALETITSWIAPPSLTGFIGYLFLFTVTVALAVVYVLSARAQHDSIQPLLQLPSLILLFFALYSIMLILTIALFDAKTPLDNRLLSPLYLLGVILVCCLIGKLIVSQSAFGVRAIAVAVFVMLIGYYVTSSGEMLRESHQYGLGLAGKRWQEYEAVAKIKNLPENVAIYTNRPYAVYLLTGRMSRLLPEEPPGGPDARYLAEVASMREQLKKRAAILLQFDIIESRWEQLWHSPPTSVSQNRL
jgi:hypothetical protein